MKKIIASLIAIIVICIVILFVGDKNSNTEVQVIEFVPISPVVVTETISENQTNESPPRQPIVTEYYYFDGGEKSEEILWELLNKYAPNQNCAAAALSMMHRETIYKSNAICGWLSYRYERPNCCEEFVAMIDAGLEDGSSYEDFIHYTQEVYGGFGLYSLCGYGSLERFYRFAQDWGTTIADAEMQCAFLFWDIENYHPDLWDMLLNAPNAYWAGQYMGTGYEGTSEYDVTAWYSDVCYKKYVEIAED